MAAIAVALVAGAPAAVSDGWETFRTQHHRQGCRAQSSARFSSASGNGRYQYWKSAVDAFETQPTSRRRCGTTTSSGGRATRLSGFLRNAHSLLFRRSPNRSRRDPAPARAVPEQCWWVVSRLISPTPSTARCSPLPSPVAPRSSSRLPSTGCGRSRSCRCASSCSRRRCCRTTSCNREAALRRLPRIGGDRRARRAGGAGTAALRRRRRPRQPGRVAAQDIRGAGSRLHRGARAALRRLTPAAARARPRAQGRSRSGRDRRAGRRAARADELAPSARARPDRG